MGQTDRAARPAAGGDDVQSRLIENSLDCVKVLDVEGRLQHIARPRA